MHVNCLIVDDETELADMTSEYFTMFGVSCAAASCAADCLAYLAENTADILLLDINLVQESGFDLCKKIRETLDIPILFISARQSDDDVLIALNIGGDDYIKKPYSLSVLLAKVKVILKRAEAAKKRGAGQTASVSADGVLRLEEDKLCVYVKRSGDPERSGDGAPRGGGIPRGGGTEKAVVLKAKEFALLKRLFEDRGKIVTKEQLFSDVWGDAFYSDGTLNVHIRRLREKIEENPSEPKLIKTIWGTGYMLDVQ